MQASVPCMTLAQRADDPAVAPRRASEAWLDAYRAVRRETERRAAPLSPEDQLVQSMADASPTKWHRAHTTWFFEQFLLVDRPGYAAFDPHFAFLFNSYYVQAGPRHARPRRGLLTRPTADEVSAYRAHVDVAVERLLESDSNELGRLLPILEIGLHHEQQHQELILTDILHAFAQNPIRPAYHPAWTDPARTAGPTRNTDPPRAPGPEGAEIAGGIHRIGHESGVRAGSDVRPGSGFQPGSGFAFDNEGPAHDVLLRPARISRRLVTNAEWLEFMADGGYAEPVLWLSDGWAAAQAEAWAAPGYWQDIDGAWWSMTLGGLRPVDPAAPVRHVSYYEADAFARWAGKRLPSESEWEVAARAGELADGFGLVWQWTSSPYAPYPGYRPAPGALGEYNGKFMVNQFVLRGSSLATPDGHARVTYRNFFYPHQRWQFTGLRLAEDLD